MFIENIPAMRPWLPTMNLTFRLNPGSKINKLSLRILPISFPRSEDAGTEFLGSYIAFECKSRFQIQMRGKTHIYQPRCKDETNVTIGQEDIVQFEEVEYTRL